MAFVDTVSGRTVYGNHRVVWGTYAQGETDAGGDIETGMDVVYGFSTVPTGQVGSTAPKYSVSGGTVTLVTDNGVDGNWIAFGL